ncbi:rhomboid family intramembrane serine protease [Salisaeta longa]|uniref:rhomboid family intramembrane serine protease n=1 Tax=Salisaeta longa TaxID=503170 RepID=UPI0003B47C90|nr:rhomboid family intramembrane serine protease [Salisaeta longa]
MPGLSDAPITLLLILANVLVSGYAFVGDASLLDELSFRPRRVRDEGEYYRFISAGFVHASFGHLLFNLITLYFFGPWLERFLGPAGYLVLYFGSMLAAHGLTYVKHRDNWEYAAVGASGAVSGVLFAFCLYRPLAMLGVFFVIPMPAILFAVLYVVGSIYAMNQGEGMAGGIAHEAHLGGALGGLLLTIALDPTAIVTFLRAIRGLF